MSKMEGISFSEDWPKTKEYTNEIEVSLSIHHLLSNSMYIYIFINDIRSDTTINRQKESRIPTDNRSTTRDVTH